MLFGWAKPVPVNFRNLRPLRLGMALVAIAGPLTNIVLAFIFSRLYIGRLYPMSPIFAHGA